MTPDQDWSTVAAERGVHNAAGGLGSLRVALLFGAGAIAFALLAAPLAERSTNALLAGETGLDTMSTGSIGQAGSSSYTIRRSVLQSDPNSVCIIRANGARAGDC